MKGQAAVLLLGTLGLASAISLAEDPKFPYKVPDPNANRSPCPVLNTLANHGYLPRDGMNITIEQLKFAFSKALNVDEKVTIKLAEPTFSISTTGNASTVNLKDMEKHNVIEHDGSLSRADVAVTGNANTFDANVWNGVKTHFTGPTIDTKTMAIARKNRVEVAMMTNPKFNMTAAQLRLSFAESAFILGILAGDFKNPQAQTKYMNVLFEQERFPFDEGFKTSAKKVTGEQVDILVGEMMKISLL